MGRLATATTAFVLALALGAIVTDGPVSAASASPASTGLAVGHGASARVKPRSSWTLLPSGFPCETDLFGRNHTFAATESTSADKGHYGGTKFLTMTWTAGDAKGEVFKGTWSKRTGDYTGTDVIDGTNDPVTLAPVISVGCALVTTAAQSPSVTPGETDADGVTVTGQDGFTPTGIVEFYVCPGDAACTINSPGATSLGNATLAPSAGSNVVATAASRPFTPPGPGPYCFLGIYPGSPHYSVSSDSSPSDECFTVTGSAAGAL
jgi:hypothetical protein